MLIILLEKKLTFGHALQGSTLLVRPTRSQRLSVTYSTIVALVTEISIGGHKIVATLYSDIISRCKMQWKSFPNFEPCHDCNILISAKNPCWDNDHHMLSCGFIVQWLEHRTGNARVMGLVPVEAWIFFLLLW